MASLQIRELPDDVYAALTERANREGRSLAQQAIVELRRLPELEAMRRRDRVLKMLRRRSAHPHPDSMPDPVDLIREDRDR